MCFPRYIRNIIELFLLVILTVPSYLPVTLTGFIGEILQPHVKNLGSYVKDITDFLRKMQNVPYVLRNRGYSQVFVKYVVYFTSEVDNIYIS